MKKQDTKTTAASVEKSARAAQKRIAAREREKAKNPRALAALIEHNLGTAVFYLSLAQKYLETSRKLSKYVSRLSPAGPKKTKKQREKEAHYAAMAAAGVLPEEAPFNG